MPAKRRKRRWLRRGIVIFIILLVVAAAAYLFSGRFGRASKASGKFELSKIARGEITARLTETGTAYLEKTIEVKSKVSGTVKATVVEEGDVVKKGQLLAVIEPDNTELLRLYNKRANVANAYIRMVQAQDDLSHAKRLLEVVQGTSRDDVLRKERALCTASTNFRLSLLELYILERDMEIREGMAEKVARVLASGTEREVRRVMDATLRVFSAGGDSFVQLADVRVLSPVSGVVLQRPVEVGEMIISGTSSLLKGTVLFRIGDPSSMFIRCSVGEVDAGNVSVGQKAQIAFEAFPDERIPGKITWISPIGAKAEGSSIISFLVKIKMEETPSFAKPGMSCDVDIILAEKKDVLRVPLESVGIKDGDRYVYVKEGEGYVKRKLKLGIENESYAEVLSGLKEGEQVVLNLDEYEEIVEKQGEQRKPAAEQTKPRKHPRRRVRVRL